MTALAAVLAALAVVILPTRGPLLRGGAAPTAGPSADREGPTIEEAAAAIGLVAAVLRSGVGAVEALEAVSRVDGGPAARDLSVVAAAHRWGEPADRAWTHVGPGWAAAAVAWHAAHTAGAAPAGLLEAAARRMREAEVRRVEAAVGRAGVLLVLPLGVCFLPGFVATSVAPVVIRLLSGLGTTGG